MITTSNTVNYPSDQAVTGASKSTGKDVLGKEDFLNLFVTQLQHQNPLEPMDNGQFLSQMAQFSSLEQMQNIARAMELLTLSQSASTNSQMISLIGKRVVHPGNTFSQESGKPTELLFNLPQDCPAVKINIYNGKGEIVRTIEPAGLKPGFNSFEFDGLDQSGEALAAGRYEYRFVRADGKSDKLNIESFSNLLVDSVAFGNNMTLLKSGDIAIPLEDILEVRSSTQNQGG